MSVHHLQAVSATLERQRGAWKVAGDDFIEAVEDAAKSLVTAVHVGAPELPNVVMTAGRHITVQVPRFWLQVDEAIYREILKVYAAIVEAEDSGGAGRTPRTETSLRHLEMHVLAPLADHPAVASVVGKLLTDAGHPLGLTASLTDDERRDATVAALRQLAEHRTLGDSSLAEWMAAHPGVGPLFESTRLSLNVNSSGVPRKDAFAALAGEADPARVIGVAPTAKQRDELRRYARRLQRKVMPAVDAEMRELTTLFPGARLRVRTKGAGGILEKVRRINAGGGGRAARDAYSAVDVFDAVASRIVTADVSQLADVYEWILDWFGTGDDGRVLGVENTYVNQKARKLAYRAIHVDVRFDVGGLPYVCELQLTSLRASIAADLDHNAIYKPFIETTPLERSAVLGMLDEAAAMDQADTIGGVR